MNNRCKTKLKPSTSHILQCLRKRAQQSLHSPSRDREILLASHLCVICVQTDLSQEDGGSSAPTVVIPSVPP